MQALPWILGVLVGTGVILSVEEAVSADAAIVVNYVLVHSIV